MSPLEPTPPFLKSLIWMNPLLFSMGKSRSRRQKKFDHSPTVRSHISKSQIYFLFLLRFYLLISICLFIIFIYLYFREGKGERKRGRETLECGCLCAPPTGDLARNPGTCPDWDSNWRPFGSQAGPQSTEPHQPGLFSNIPESKKRTSQENCIWSCSLCLAQL